MLLPCLLGCFGFLSWCLCLRRFGWFWCLLEFACLLYLYCCLFTVLVLLVFYLFGFVLMWLLLVRWWFDLLMVWWVVCCLGFCCLNWFLWCCWLSCVCFTFVVACLVLFVDCVYLLLFGWFGVSCLFNFWFVAWYLLVTLFAVEGFVGVVC